MILAFFRICCSLLIGVSLSGCVWISSLSTQWSENIAKASYGTKADNPALNDGKLETVASLKPQKGERIFTLTFPQVKPVRKIVIHNENLFYFDVDYWDLKTSAWKTIHTVRHRRNTGNSRAQPQYSIDRLNIKTNRIRVNVLRTVDDRLLATGFVDFTNDKVTWYKGNYHGNYMEMYRFVRREQARIREIEVYHLQSP